MKMKKFKFLSMAFMALMMAASFVACSNDDDPTPVEKENSCVENSSNPLLPIWSAASVLTDLESEITKGLLL